MTIIFDLLLYTHIILTNITFCIAKSQCIRSPKKSNQLLVWFAESSTIWFYLIQFKLLTFNISLMGWLLFIWLYTFNKTFIIPFFGVININQSDCTIRSWWKISIILFILSYIPYSNICVAFILLVNTIFLWWYTLQPEQINLNNIFKYHNTLGCP